MSLRSRPTLFVGLGRCADAQNLLSGWLGIASNSDKLLAAPANKALSLSSPAGDQDENENEVDEDTNAVKPPAAQEAPIAA